MSQITVSHWDRPDSFQMKTINIKGTRDLDHLAQKLSQSETHFLLTRTGHLNKEEARVLVQQLPSECPQERMELCVMLMVLGASYKLVDVQYSWNPPKDGRFKGCTNIYDQEFYQNGKLINLKDRIDYLHGRVNAYLAMHQTQGPNRNQEFKELLYCYFRGEEPSIDYTRGYGAVQCEPALSNISFIDYIQQIGAFDPELTKRFLNREHPIPTSYINKLTSQNGRVEIKGIDK